MKKSFVLLLALVLLVSGTAYFAQTELLKEKDQVHYTEHVLYGDKSVVDGVTVEANVMYNNQLFWKTVYEIGEEPKEETEYTFSAWPYFDDILIQDGSLWFNIDCTDTFDILEFDKSKTYYGLEIAMKELYDSTPAGTEKQTTVFLKDYVDYYSFMFDVTLPFHSGSGDVQYESGVIWGERNLREDIAMLEQSGMNPKELERLKKHLADLEAFRAFFKIPVIEGEAYTLAIVKDEKGEVIGMADSHAMGGQGTGEINIPDPPKVEGLDVFSFKTSSVFADGYCYFTFDPHTENGELVDVSQIPGGYGIYRFSYDNKKGTIDLSNLEMVYPLDVNHTYSSIATDHSEKNILLFSEDGKNSYMSVIDRETLKLMDYFVLGPVEEYFTERICEDFIIVMGDYLMVYPLDENGRYSQAFSVDSRKIDQEILKHYPNLNPISWESVFDWDGQTLLIVDPVIYHDENLRNTYTCDYYVVAVDKTGLLYYGMYESSLTSYAEQYDYCMFKRDMSDPIRIYWNK